LPEPMLTSPTLKEEIKNKLFQRVHAENAREKSGKDLAATSFD
jgi:hypothetical protein